jgi:hypothetical protein
LVRVENKQLIDSKGLLEMLKTANTRTSSSLRVGVHPLGETDCNLTVCRWLKNAVHFVASAADSVTVGEAAPGSGGDQPVKE